MTNIIIVDDHRMVSEGLERLISGSDNLKVVAKAFTLHEAMELTKSLQPQVMLLDIALPDGDGIDAIPEMREACPDMHIIMFTMYAELSVIKRALNNNAEGYVLKSAEYQELDEAIRKVIKGDVFLCNEIQDIIGNDAETVPTLTEREREILRLIAEGYSMKEISKMIFLSFETVHSYCKSIKLKLKCNNNASLVKTAISQHLV